MYVPSYTNIMKFAILLIVNLITCSCIPFEQITIKNSTCSSYNISKFYFQIQKFQGKWYEIYKYGEPENCSTMFISPIQNRTQSNITHYTGSTKQGTYTSSIIMEQKFNFSNEVDINIPQQNKMISARMLETDYKNYAVLWSCSNQLLVSSTLQTLLILSQYNHGNFYMDRIHEVLNSTGIAKNNATLSPVDHSSTKCSKSIFANSTTFNSTYYPNYPGRNGGNTIISTFLNKFLSTFLIVTSIQLLTL